LAGAPVLAVKHTVKPFWHALTINLIIPRGGKIIILINIAIKRLLTSGYPAGYPMSACPFLAEGGGIT
jgi:hypothetical protein